MKEARACATPYGRGARDALNKVYNMDCMEAMRKAPDKCFDLAVVDPPYGIDVGNMNMGSGNSPKCSKVENRLWGKTDFDKARPTPEYFAELFRVSKHQVIFGGNYFGLPPTRCFIVWDKGESLYGRSFSDCEYAWTNFETAARIFKHPPFDKLRFHPTQKPVALYKWIYAHYAKPGDKILDTHLGSGSSRIAAYDMGLDFVGFEIDKGYFEKQEERFKEHTAQTNLFIDVQPAMQLEWRDMPEEPKD